MLLYSAYVITQMWAKIHRAQSTQKCKHNCNCLVEFLQLLFSKVTVFVEKKRLTLDDPTWFGSDSWSHWCLYLLYKSIHWVYTALTLHCVLLWHSVVTVNIFFPLLVLLDFLSVERAVRLPCMQTVGFIKLGQCLIAVITTTSKTALE